MVRILKKEYNIKDDTLFIYFCDPRPREHFTGTEMTYTQEALFYWLSGWPDPDSAIVIDMKTNKSYLVLPEFDPSHAIWTAPVPKQADVIRQTGGLVAFLTLRKPSLLMTVPTPHSVSLIHTMWNGLLDTSTFLPAAFSARLVKSESEISHLKAASELTGEAIIQVLKHLEYKNGLSEHHISAMFQYYGALTGCNRLAFPTVVGAGKNACYLHRIDSQDRIKKDDLVLLDCGLFCNHYAGDITRTFPVSGRFTRNQRLVYEEVLKLQKKLILAVSPGMTLDDLNLMCCDGIFNICVNIGIVPRGTRYVDDLVAAVCPHGVSHHIGCNCHDEVTLVEAPLEPGMVISVEPGIYFNVENIRAVKLCPVIMERVIELADTVGGIRIEDDILVTDRGCEVLSKNCPKSIREIELLMQRKVHSFSHIQCVIPLIIIVFAVFLCRYNQYIV